MIETEEIDVEQLMAEIREAVARREAEGRRRSLVGVSFELSGELRSADGHGPAAGQAEVPPPLSLQPEFVPAEDDRYHVNDLLQYHDQTFVWNAYRAILKREPDEAGLREFLRRLRAGRLNKLDVLAALSFSVEGRARGVRLDGLARRPVLRRLYRVPVLGYVLEMLAAIARLPAMIRSRRQFENHALAQQELIAARVNQLAQMSFPVMDSLSRELAGMAESQRRYAELQHQQVVGLFREQRALAERLEKLEAELDARPNESPASPRGDGRKAEAVTRARLDGLFARFADEFRGPRDEVKEGLKFYLPFLKEAGVRGDLLDLGCGRGEWLELLKEEGVEARGVEMNGALVEEMRARKLKVTEEDALEHLRKVEDASLSAVTGFHFIEHLSFESLVELLDEAARVLRPGGLVIFETPNPKNLTVGACNFYADPTHARPLFPETVRFVLVNCGFADVRVEYVNSAGGSPFTDESEGSRALDGWLYGPRDFAVIGRKA